MSDTVQKIKERLSIVEVVGSYMKLEKAGRHYKGRSPFSNEKTPSFFVSTDQNLYHCFSTGKGGDIFSFVQEMEGVDFKGALKILAEKANIPIEYEKTGEKNKRDKLYEILDEATSKFQENLKGNQGANEYLEKRGLTKDTISSWRIGYAKNEWSDIYSYFTNKKIREEDLFNVGIITKSEKGKVYDRFRGRIMFPLFNPNGNVVGYSGRLFEGDEKMAKYINSPETELFQKSELLYGYNFAKQNIRKLDFSILVEGQVDVVMSHQAGYTNTVATSGTALTMHQLELLRRLSTKMVIALDGDGAGLKASKRAWQMALSLGMDVKIAMMPEGSDPAEVILNNKEDWKNYIKGAKHIIEILIDVVMKIDDRRKRLIQVREEIIPYIASMESSIEQSHFVDIVSRSFDIEKDALWGDIRRVDVEEGESNGFEEIKTEKPKEKVALSKQLLALYIWQKNKGKSDIDMDKFKSSLEELFEDGSLEKLLKDVEENNKDLLITTELHYGEKAITDEDVDPLINRARMRIREIRRDKLKKELQEAERQKDDTKSEEILRQIQDISNELSKLQGGL